MGARLSKKLARLRLFNRMMLKKMKLERVKEEKMLKKADRERRSEANMALRTAAMVESLNSKIKGLTAENSAEKGKVVDEMRRMSRAEKQERQEAHKNAKAESTVNNLRIKFRRLTKRGERLAHELLMGKKMELNEAEKVARAGRALKIEYSETTNAERRLNTKLRELHHNKLTMTQLLRRQKQKERKMEKHFGRLIAEVTKHKLKAGLLHEESEELKKVEKKMSEKLRKSALRRVMLFKYLERLHLKEKRARAKEGNAVAAFRGVSKKLKLVKVDLKKTLAKR